MLKVGIKDLLAQANSMIETVSVQDLETHVDNLGAIIVDVRESSEWEKEGSIPGAIHASRGLLEFHVDPASEMHISALVPDQQIILYCGTGGRSALAAKTLVEMGYTDVRSLAGGYAAWHQAKKVE